MTTNCMQSVNQDSALLSKNDCQSLRYSELVAIYRVCALNDSHSLVLPP